MVEVIKKKLRIKHNELNEDILSDIETCKCDLKIAGVNGDNEEDPLIKKCYELYVKWQYDYQGKGEQFERAYKNLKDALALSGDYNV